MALFTLSPAEVAARSRAKFEQLHGEEIHHFVWYVESAINMAVEAGHVKCRIVIADSDDDDVVNYVLASLGRAGFRVARTGNIANIHWSMKS